jgi:hypothetical protein
MSRPTEKTPEIIRKIEEAAAMDCSMEEMAFFANIHRATLYRWLKEDEELSDRINELKQTPFLNARQTIIKAIKENPQYAFEYMKRKKKNEFSERSEVTGPDGEALQPILVKFLNGNETGNNRDTAGVSTPVSE